jgi:HEAT repeat protein
MTKRQPRRVYCILLLIVFCSGIWTVTREREPKYEGLQEREWLESLQFYIGDPREGDTNDPAFKAFQNLGKRAMPELMDIIQRKQSLSQRLALFINHKQKLIRLPISENRKWLGPWGEYPDTQWAIYAVGSNAIGELPTFTNMLFHSNDPKMLATGAMALAGIGSDGVPYLLQALTNQVRAIRLAAVSCLGWERANSGEVVRSLVKCKNDSDTEIRVAAIISLGRLHTLPEITVPMLLDEYSDNNARERTVILTALGNFGSKAEAAIPTLKEAMEDKDPAVRRQAKLTLDLVTASHR